MSKKIHCVIRLSVITFTIVCVSSMMLHGQSLIEYTKPSIFWKNTKDSTQMSNKYKGDGLYLFPLVRYNTTDDLIFGLHASTKYKGLILDLQPGYSIGTKSLRGEANVSYSIKRGGINWLPYLQYKTYGFNENPNLDYHLAYRKISGGLRAKISSKGISNIIDVGIKSIDEDFALFSSPTEFKLQNLQFTQYSLRFVRAVCDSLYPRKIHLNLESVPRYGDGESFTKVSARISQKFKYKGFRSFDISIWGTYFLHNTQRDVFSYNSILVRGSEGLIFSSGNDYAYDLYYIDRKEGTVGQGYYLGGGFKNNFGRNRMLGQTNHLAYAINLKFDLPFAQKYFPISAFADAGQYYENSLVKPKTLFSAGLLLNYKYFTVSLPMVNSAEINQIYQDLDRGFFERATISVNFSKFPEVFFKIFSL